MNTLLIFPPGWQPYSPYLALPLLKGYLKTKNIEVDILDGNVEFYDYVLSKYTVEKCYKTCLNNFYKISRQESSNQEFNEKYLKYSKAVLMESVIYNIEDSKKKLREKDFYKMNEKEEIYSVISSAFFLINLANKKIKVTFDKISFSFSDQDTQEIINCINDMDDNPLMEYYQEIIKRINYQNKDFVAISITSNDQIIPGMLLAKLIKERCQKVKHISLGGNYITRLAEEWKERHKFFDYIDSIMVYEGEEALHQLIRALDGKVSFEEIPNLYYIKNGSLIKNPLSQVSKDKFAIPDFDGFPLDKYFSAQVILPVYSSRSCFNKCAFCTIPYASSNKYRTIDLEYVSKMVDVLSKKYNTKYFTFIDETFEIHRMYQFAQKIMNKKIDIYWYAETRFSKAITEELCKSLYSGGCRNIQFGLESYNQNILDKMRKNVKIEWIEPSLINCIKNGIGVHMFFMIGFPGETIDEAMNTLNFTQEIIDKSRYVYGNYYTTRGYGGFNLNKYSYVWQNPEEFGVEIIEDKSSDLTLKCDYNVKSGISEAEANELVSKSKEDPNMYIKEKGYLTFFNHINLSIGEEHNFLREVSVSKDENTNKYKVRIGIDNISESCKVSLNKDTRFVKLKKNILRSDFEEKENIILYNVIKNKIEQLDIKYYQIVLEISKSDVYIGDIRKRYGNKFMEKVESMLYYGLLDINCDIDKKSELFNGKIQFNKNVEVIKYPESNIIRLYNENNGCIIKVSALGYKLLKILNEETEYKRYVKFLQDNNFVNDEEDIINFLQTLLDTDIVNIKI